MKLAQRNNIPVWQRSALLLGFIGGKFSTVIRSSVRTSPWIRETRVVEAKGPEVEGTPFKLSSGENILSECMCVRVREYMLSKGSFLSSTTKYCAFCSFL